jgi:hypothetical protein
MGRFRRGNGIDKAGRAAGEQQESSDNHGKPEEVDAQREGATGPGRKRRATDWVG